MSSDAEGEIHAPGRKRIRLEEQFDAESVDENSDDQEETRSGEGVFPKKLTMQVCVSI